MKLNFQGQSFNIKMMYCKSRPVGNIGEMTVNLSADDILYIENYNRNTFIHAKTGEYLITQPFNIFKRLLENDKRFQYCHCSYLVNMGEVYAMGNDEISIVSDYKTHIIPFPKRRQKSFISAYEKMKKQ